MITGTLPAAASLGRTRSTTTLSRTPSPSLSSFVVTQTLSRTAPA
jgi:hypothetical protein